MSRHNTAHRSDRESLDELGALLSRHDAEVRAAGEEFARWVEENKDKWVEEYARTFSAEQRRKAAKEGASLPDGSYPIYNQEDADNAAKAIGRGSAAKGTIVAHIRKRVKALGLKAPAVAGAMA